MQLAHSLPPLAARQEDILRALLRGAHNDEIAEELSLSLGTVKREVAVLLRLFEVRRRSTLVLRCAGAFGS